jgi:hypothetical protein
MKAKVEECIRVHSGCALIAAWDAANKEDQLALVALRSHELKSLLYAYWREMIYCPP